MQRPFALLALATLALAAPAVRAQTGYVFHDLGTLGGASSYAYGVNSLGQVVGGYTPAGSTAFNLFLWLPAPAYGLPAGMNALGTLGGSIATAINDSGEIVGRDSHAVLWLPTARYGLPAGLNDLNALPQIAAAGFVATSAYSINNHHQIGGTARAIADNSSHGFVFDLGTGAYTDLGTAMTNGRSLNNNPQPQVVAGGLMYSFASNTYTSLSPLNAMGINDLGAITGSAVASSSYHAYYRNPAGQLTDIGALGTSGSRVDAINNAGVYPATIVGYSFNRQLLAHAFRWRVGSAAMDDLNLISTGLGKFTLAEATGIGDGGYIVGYANLAVKGGTSTHAFLLTPQ